MEREKPSNLNRASDLRRSSLRAVPRPELIATKVEVLASIGAQQTCIVNPLDADEYAGRGPVNMVGPGTSRRV